MMCCFPSLFILLFFSDLPKGGSQLWARSVCLAVRFIGVVLQNPNSWAVTEGHGKSWAGAAHSHVVPDRVGQDDNAALTFLQFLGSSHSHGHGTARAATCTGTQVSGLPRAQGHCPAVGSTGWPREGCRGGTWWPGMLGWEDNQPQNLIGFKGCAQMGCRDVLKWWLLGF